MINRQNETGGLITRTVIGVKGKAKVGENGIEKIQTAEATETRFEEQELIGLLHCQCGAILKNAEEIGAIDCISKEFLCIECAKTKCSRCLKSVGVESRMNIFGGIYCKKCTIKVLIIAVSMVSIFIAIVLLILL